MKKKLEMRHVDEQARRLLERTERRPEDDLMKLHGTSGKMSFLQDADLSK